MKPVAILDPIVNPMRPSVLRELRQWRLQAKQRRIALSLERNLPKAHTHARTIPQHNQTPRR